MNFRQATLKGIRDDILKSTMVITLELERNPENIRLCEELSHYKPTKTTSGYMDVNFEPHQLPLFHKESE
jgi:hypothetical protein